MAMTSARSPGMRRPRKTISGRCDVMASPCQVTARPGTPRRRPPAGYPRRNEQGGRMGTTSEGPARSDAEAMIAEAKKALWVMVGLLAVLWVIQLVNAPTGYDLSHEFGIEARDPASLPEIFSAP